MRELIATILIVAGLYVALWLGSAARSWAIFACGVALIAVGVVGLVRKIKPQRRR